jgi:hypothetical protein|tara:strand:- start:3921 stop:4634 length:714 start_codon:yes stop_codon:yes gene_type:complete
MNYDKSLNFLKRYVSQEIDTSQKTTHDDAGARGLILMVQDNYKINLGLPTENVDDLRDAMLVSYPIKDVERLSGRKYVADVLLKKNIDLEDYIKQITYYNKIISSSKSLTIEQQINEGYELTHLIWALFTIVKDNHLIRTYKDFMIWSLQNLYIRIPDSTDVSTEALYFLSKIDSFAIKEKWIMKLESDQDSNGVFTGFDNPKELSPQQLLLLQVHHTALALLTLYNFYNGNREVND